jgi:hypothetical protein
MIIIGVTGKAGSGKDAVANILTANHGFVKIALADPMKRFLSRTLNFTNEQLWGPSQKRNAPDVRYPREHTFDWHAKTCLCCGAFLDDLGAQCYLTPRFALQQLGTEWGRSMYPDIWVDFAFRIVEVSGVAVIPDVRFPNEVAKIKAAGGRIWWRSGAGSLTSSPASHESEAYDLDYDEEIPWLDSVDNLPAEVACLLKRIT